MTVVENKLIKRFESFVLGKCRCGCNEEIPIRNQRGFLRRFQQGHNTKFGKETGVKNRNWKGGKHINQRGYIKILKGRSRYISEHRYVIESYLGRKLSSTEVIHHINGNKLDNRIENLMIFSSNGEHLRFERTGKKYKK